MGGPGSGRKKGSASSRVKKWGYSEHHTSLSKGYTKVGTEGVKKYSGKFGKGYKITSNNPQSSRYQKTTYYTKKK